MNYTGILFALASTLSWSFCIFPFTSAARRLGGNSLNHFRLIVAVLIVGTISFLSFPVSFRNIFKPEFLACWLWLGLSGIIGLTIGDYFAFTMYKILGARRGSVLTTFAPAATLITGALIINERISVIGVAGIFITIAGVNILSFSRSERETIKDLGFGRASAGVVMGILSAICQGAGLVLAKKGILQNSELLPLHATFIRLIIACISLYIFSFVTGNFRSSMDPIFKNKNNGLWPAVLGTIFGPVTAVCLSLYTISILQPTVAQTIFSLVPVFAFILSAVFMKERISEKSYYGLLTAIAGVLILIWRENILALLNNT